MNLNHFYESKGPFLISNIFPEIKKHNNFQIFDVKPLDKSSESDLTFFDSVRYINHAKNTKSRFCITSPKLKQHLPKNCFPVVVKNVLYDLCRVLKKFYPDADADYLDITLKPPSSKLFKDVKFAPNVFLGDNCLIGRNTTIGPNTIIEKSVSIGNNCIIGSNVTIKNSFIGNNVVIQNGCKIGLKGFGFIPLKNKNIKFPHIGKVIIEDNVEIAANCTIDRGSIDDTIIGKNTYLDNQVHVAHNVKLGDNCLIAGQVGFAGSSIIGNDVSIGGQAGISGHLRVGNNVRIGGGSGVVKDIPDNSTVMGYPAVSLKDFLKNKKYE
jgi:UDP-3-O-[3-hydroxymyristoyl] glucosamine N-acyltransferase